MHDLHEQLIVYLRLVRRYCTASRCKHCWTLVELARQNSSYIYIGIIKIQGTAYNVIGYLPFYPRGQKYICMQTLFQQMDGYEVRALQMQSCFMKFYLTTSSSFTNSHFFTINVTDLFRKDCKLGILGLWGNQWIRKSNWVGNRYQFTTAS